MMNYSPYGSIGETPKWRLGVYILAVAAITAFLGHQFGAKLYWGIPVGVGFLVFFFIGINCLVRDRDRRARLAPYAKWLIWAAVMGNIILIVWGHWSKK